MRQRIWNQVLWSRTYRIAVLVGVFFSCANIGGVAKASDWKGALGVGVLSDPTIPAFFLQMDWPQTAQWSVGPMAILAAGTNASVLAMGFQSRMVLTGHPRILPNLEGGVSFVRHSLNGTDTLGALLSGGVGFDFVVRQDLLIGVQVKANALLPGSVSFVSFSLLTVRIPI